MGGHKRDPTSLLRGPEVSSLSDSRPETSFVEKVDTSTAVPERSSGVRREGGSPPPLKTSSTRNPGCRRMEGAVEEENLGPELK